MSPGGHTAELPDELLLVLADGEVDINSDVLHALAHHGNDICLDVGDCSNLHVSAVEEGHITIGRWGLVVMYFLK